MAMSSDIKLRWLDALRSGNYRQAQGALQRTFSPYTKYDVGYCCLGVLADIQGCDWDMQHLATSRVPEKYSAGLKIEEQEKLATMNDNGKTFSEIADYVEENF